MNRVVVTGMGIVSPLGCHLDKFWNKLVAGESGVVSLTDSAYQKLPSRIGALVNGFPADQYFSQKEMRRISRSSQYAIVAAEEAITQAGIPGSDLDLNEIAVIIGSSIGGFAAADPFFKDFYLRQISWPLTIPTSMNVGPSSNISIRFGFKGPLFTVDAACASGPHSIGYAYNMIRFGLLEVAVTGGADCPFSPPVVGAWCGLRALSERNEFPAQACRPFSDDRDGLVLGEGAGILILESEESALRRGRRIWAEVVGYGSTSDSFHLTQPNYDGPARAIGKALKDADLSIEEIDYINAHGTGTRLNDGNETRAIKQVFGQRAYSIPVVSNKAATGHAISATGAIEVISCILSINNHVIPPTLNYHVPDPECDLDYVIEGSRVHDVKIAMSNSFGFGGSNAVLIVGKYP